MNTLVVSDTPDNIDYAKLVAARQLAMDTGCIVVARGICLECPADVIVPPQGSDIEFRHEDFCPVWAAHDGRKLTERQERRHRRYMDGGA
ncbi:hypothetical protein ACWDTP_04995 [Mycobacterium sp. NPDC003449]